MLPHHGGAARLCGQRKRCPCTSYQYLSILKWPPKVQQNKYFYHEDGHGVVLEVNSHEYIYIGESVYKFVVLAKLTRLESYIGNNDVPYPCVVDQHHNVYLFIDQVIIKHLTRKTFGNSTDVYEFYYKYKDKIPQERLQSMQTKTIRKRIN